MVILSVFQPPESPVLHEQRNTRAVLDNKDLGLGTLYISERTLCWREQGNLGFCIDHPHISIHAIASDPNVYPSECVFIVIDGHISMPDAVQNQSPHDDEDSESEADVSQLILVPDDLAAIKTIYSNLNQCQVLNPDPDVSFDEDDNIYEDAEDYGDNDNDLVSNGRTNDLGAGGDTEMSHLSAQLHNQSIHTDHAYGNGDQNFDDDRFEDAD